jgi:hypothetical protein
MPPTVSSCFLHGAHAGEECPLCEVVIAVRAARALLEQTEGRREEDNFRIDQVVELLAGGLEGLERIGAPR